MQFNLEMPSPKTSLGGSTRQTMPSAVSWQDLSAQMMPCVRHSTEEAGPVSVWLPGQGHGRHGGFSMLNISEWPNDAAVCSLSQILETGPIPQKYYLSAKACSGIIRRAEKRGKELPQLLQRALNASAAIEQQGGDSAVNAHGGPHGRLDFESETFVAEPIVHAIQAGALRENPNSGPDGVGVQEDLAYTIEARAEVQAVAFDMRGREGGSQFEGPHDTANIRAASGGSSRSYVADTWAVRRLTPTECARLQGFPDDYPRITYRGKIAADGPIYKALGNSWAVPCGAWILKRTAHALATQKEPGA